MFQLLLRRAARPRPVAPLSPAGRMIRLLGSSSSSPSPSPSPAVSSATATSSPTTWLRPVATATAARRGTSSSETGIAGDLLRRLFSSSTSGGGGGGDDDDDDDDGKTSEMDGDGDFFSSPDSGPAFPPPSYVRDPVTGKWTDATRPELGMEGRRLLNLDDEGRAEVVAKRVSKRWADAAKAASTAGIGGGGGGVGVGVEEGGGDGFGTISDEHARVARRVREQRLALGQIGRDPADRHGRFRASAGEEEEEEDDEMDNGLTTREYRALKTYAKKEHGIDHKDFDAAISSDDGNDDLIPKNFLSSGYDDDGGGGGGGGKGFFDADLDLAYLNPRLHRKAFGRSHHESTDDPLADLLPSDLNPARKVNRRNAHPIPTRLLHHNNLSLLRRYTTPGGKIMNRVQSRLGAKDQRKIAKLVKRARHLGLVPHIGQWKFEDHGAKREFEYFGRKDDSEKNEEGGNLKDWEVELERRGLWPLQDGTELAKRFYDMEGMLEHIAGPRGGKKRAELDRLLGGPGALVEG